ncbi:3'(2'),5'-bisphosphate nucleotidase CysQ [Motilimonas cestriensis]|uniref:3'(2'),5'-bisphosphate nucleotidase CysQ n=1 Tax=Motilimonas cestriensis TaxID=2742685 RepID=A0ABS8WAY8_9GAMM|nr:3'(2'),5'-bisphosphate nucleotidase CysQ [Motilimonas cestriensis]MCE2594560.1 3'(2'),5'-bisphosphate nucleotidase CysQ [Motilimonas cestriensis]
MATLIDKPIADICDIARLAGEAILEIYQRDFEVQTKSDQSPLTEADLAAHNVIVKGLQAATPDIPILSEEAADISWQVRQTWQTFWLVDPLDGTKEFIKKNGEFTVNIALIHNNKPVLGVVYAPVLDKLYFADENGSFLTENGATRRLKVEAPAVGETVKIVGSRSHPSPDLAEYLTRFENYEMVPVGSSLKFCMVAEGAAHIYPRLGPTMNWDTGAGHCVAEQAGATVCQLDGSALLYNHQESLLNPYFEVK